MYLYFCQSLASSENYSYKLQLQLFSKSIKPLNRLRSLLREVQSAKLTDKFQRIKFFSCINKNYNMYFKLNPNALTDTSQVLFKVKGRYLLHFFPDTVTKRCNIGLTYVLKTCGFSPSQLSERCRTYIYTFRYHATYFSKPIFKDMLCQVQFYSHGFQSTISSSRSRKSILYST